METRKFKVQLVTEGSKWPYVGNAYLNKSGSINVYLYQRVTLTGGQKLNLNPAREKAAATEPPQQAPAEATS